MITYAIVNQTQLTSELARMFEYRGATVAQSFDKADVVLLAVESVEELATALAQLGGVACKAIGIGPLPSVSVLRAAEPGTLEGTLEKFRPLGIFNWHNASCEGIPGFVGPRDVADVLDAGIVKAFATENYGSWIMREGQDAADFICRVVAAQNSLRSSNAAFVV